MTQSIGILRGRRGANESIKFRGVFGTPGRSHRTGTWRRRFRFAGSAVILPGSTVATRPPHPTEFMLSARRCSVIVVPL